MTPDSRKFRITTSWSNINSDPTRTFIASVIPRQGFTWSAYLPRDFLRNRVKGYGKDHLSAMADLRTHLTVYEVKRLNDLIVPVSVDAPGGQSVSGEARA